MSLQEENIRHWIAQLQNNYDHIAELACELNSVDSTRITPQDLADWERRRKTLKEQLRDDEASREQIMQHLVNAGPAAVPPLLTVLQSPTADALTRLRVMHVLSRIRDPRAVESLLDILHTGELMECVVAAIALAGIGDRRAVGPLIDTLDNAETRAKQARPAAYRAVSALLDAATSAALFVYLLATRRGVRPENVRESERSLICVQLIHALKTLGDRRAIPAITRRLQDRNARVRQSAQKALAQLQTS